MIATFPKFSAATLAFLLSTGGAQADLTIRFIESAPKDRFVVENTASCVVQAAQLTLDLEPSAGALVVDATAEGAGVEVFQPVEIAAGQSALRAVAPATDGATLLSFEIDRIASGEGFTVTLDLDDQLPRSELGQIRVSGAEIEGAVARLSGQIDAQAIFGPEAMASLPVNCTS